jgi:hypothetical protein
MPKEHDTARTRVLSDEEIRALINGFDQTRYGRALRLLFLTALRCDEVLGLKWTLDRPGERCADDPAQRGEDRSRPWQKAAFGRLGPGKGLRRPGTGAAPGVFWTSRAFRTASTVGRGSREGPGQAAGQTTFAS